MYGFALVIKDYKVKKRNLKAFNDGFVGYVGYHSYLKHDNQHS